MGSESKELSIRFKAVILVVGEIICKRAGRLGGEEKGWYLPSPSVIPQSGILSSAYLKISPGHAFLIQELKMKPVRIGKQIILTKMLLVYFSHHFKSVNLRINQLLWIPCKT